MIMLKQKPTVDGKVRSCNLSRYRKVYFIRTYRMVLSTTYYVGVQNGVMTIIGSKRREFAVAQGGE